MDLPPHGDCAGAADPRYAAPTEELAASIEETTEIDRLHLGKGVGAR